MKKRWMAVALTAILLMAVGGAAYGGDGMSELRERVIAYNAEIKTALQAVYNDLNQGQRKKLLRNPAIRAMFERYGVEIDE